MSRRAPVPFLPLLLLLSASCASELGGDPYQPTCSEGACDETGDVGDSGAEALQDIACETAALNHIGSDAERLSMVDECMQQSISVVSELGSPVTAMSLRMGPYEADIYRRHTSAGLSEWKSEIALSPREFMNELAVAGGRTGTPDFKAWQKYDELVDWSELPVGVEATVADEIAEIEELGAFVSREGYARRVLLEGETIGYVALLRVESSNGTVYVMADGTLVRSLYP